MEERKKGGNKTYLYILKLLSFKKNVFLALSWQGKRSSLKQRHLGTRLIGEAGDGFPFAAQSRDLSNSWTGDSILQQLQKSQLRDSAAVVCDFAFGVGQPENAVQMLLEGLHKTKASSIRNFFVSHHTFHPQKIQIESSN